MKETPSVNSAIRAIDLLLAINRQPVSTVHYLHQETGIPKPSIVRLLRTLAARNLVRHAPQYGAYMLSRGITSLASGYHGAPRIIEAAQPIMDEITRDLRWPVAIAIPDHDSVRVCYSTIPQSPLSLLRSSLDMRLSLASRALGRAYLAFLPRAEQNAILARLADSSDAEDAIARDAVGMRAMLDETASRGYALRAPSVRPVSSTLAMPVFENERVAATLGITWIASAMTVDLVLQRYLDPLRQACSDVSRRLETPGAGETFQTAESSNKAFEFERAQQ